MSQIPLATRPPPLEIGSPENEQVQTCYGRLRSKTKDIHIHGLDRTEGHMGNKTEAEVASTRAIS